MRKLSTLSLLLAVSLSLTACETAASNGTKLRCPPLKEYSQDQKNKVADETDAAAKDSVWPSFMKDYRDLRAICKSLLK